MDVDPDREWVYCVTAVHGREHLGPVTAIIHQDSSTTRLDLIARIGRFLNSPPRIIVHYLERNDL